MTNEKHIESAEIFREYEHCDNIKCDDCPAFIERSCAAKNEKNLCPCMGYSDAKSKAWFENWLAENAGSVKKEEVKKVKKGKEQLIRTVTEEWQGVKYTKDSIDGCEIEGCENHLQSLIKEREVLNAEIKDVRYTLNRHATRLALGKFD